MRKPTASSSPAAFPDGFLWGTATSAHQVEGGQSNDWTDWEVAGSCAEPSGIACDHYHRFEEDIALIAGVGLNAYRFSIEWSRIEPDPGEFSAEAIRHYGRMIEACHGNGLAAGVAFHHFTNPRWLGAAGGWLNPEAPERFARFCERVGRELGAAIDLVITINEPNMPPLLAYSDGVFPPGHRDEQERLIATRHFIEAHERARDVVAPHTDAPIGMAVAMADWVHVDGGADELERIRSIREDVFLDAARADDYVGVNTYTRHRVDAGGFMDVEDGIELTMMGYEFFPEALGSTIRRAAALTGRPVIVTESGIATDDDGRRVEFIDRSVRAVGECLAGGIDVGGYFYWSALDNFEWHHGYGPRFGLISVDRQTLDRTVKPSARFLGDIARRDALPSVR